MTETTTEPPPLVEGIPRPARLKFLDGPAATARPKGGEQLRAHRAPTFLRAVIDPAGTVDALDLPDDEPKDDEVCWAYELTVVYHARGATRAASGWFAEYRCRLDVGGEFIRDWEAWVEWCTAEAARRGS
jgi:hypothetical protein